jgi:hypothetical protein
MRKRHPWGNRFVLIAETAEKTHQTKVVASALRLMCHFTIEQATASSEDKIAIPTDDAYKYLRCVFLLSIRRIFQHHGHSFDRLHFLSSHCLDSWTRICSSQSELVGDILHDDRITLSKMKPNYLHIQSQLSGVDCPADRQVNSVITMPTSFQTDIILMGGTVDVLLTADSRTMKLHNKNFPSCNGGAVRGSAIRRTNAIDVRLWSVLNV